MIELPEVVTLARQMNETIRGKRVECGVRGNSPHKFAFYTRSPEEYAAILQGKTVGEAREHGSCLLLPMEPDHALVLGGGGEHILFHPDGTTLPKKHHLLLSFDDGTHLSVSVQGWGSAQLYHVADEGFAPERRGVSPLSDAFTYDYLRGLFEAVDDSRNIKFFMISKPNIWGMGNGYLQDILFRAKVHPRRAASSLTEAEQRALYDAIGLTFQQAVALDGRDTERDLFNQPGHYVRLMDTRTAGKPCPECGAPTEKMAFMGGNCYLCPSCQV